MVSYFTVSADLSIRKDVGGLLYSGELALDEQEQKKFDPEDHDTTSQGGKECV